MEKCAAQNIKAMRRSQKRKDKEMLDLMSKPNGISSWKPSTPEYWDACRLIGEGLMQLDGLVAELEPYGKKLTLNDDVAQCQLVTTQIEEQILMSVRELYVFLIEVRRDKSLLDIIQTEAELGLDVSNEPGRVVLPSAESQK